MKRLALLLLGVPSAPLMFSTNGCELVNKAGISTRKPSPSPSGGLRGGGAVKRGDDHLGIHDIAERGVERRQ